MKREREPLEQRCWCRLFIPVCFFVFLVAAVEAQEWVVHEKPVDEPLHLIHFTTAGTGFITTYGSGEILRSVDGGKSWQFVAQLPTSFLEEIAFLSPTVGFVAGDFAFVGKTTDGGSSWMDVSPTLGEGGRLRPGEEESPGKWFGSYYTMRFEDSRKGRVQGGSGRIGYPEQRGGVAFTTDDGGESWDSAPRRQPFGFEPSMPTNCWSHYLSGEHAWFSRRGTNQLKETKDGGASWSTLEILGEDKLWFWRAVHFLDADWGFVGGEVSQESGAGLLYETKDAGETWEKVEWEGPAVHCLAQAHGRLWAIGKEGLLMSRSLDQSAEGGAE